MNNELAIPRFVRNARHNATYYSVLTDWLTWCNMCMSRRRRRYTACRDAVNMLIAATVRWLAGTSCRMVVVSWRLIQFLVVVAAAEASAAAAARRQVEMRLDAICSLTLRPTYTTSYDDMGTRSAVWCDSMGLSPWSSSSYDVWRWVDTRHHLHRWFTSSFWSTLKRDVEWRSVSDEVQGPGKRRLAGRTSNQNMQLQIACNKNVSPIVPSGEYKRTAILPIIKLLYGGKWQNSVCHCPIRQKAAHWNTLTHSTKLKPLKRQRITRLVNPQGKRLNSTRLGSYSSMAILSIHFVGLSQGSGKNLF